MASKYTSVINEKLNDFFQQGIPSFFERDLDLGTPQEPARGNLVQVIVGVRRCGKTYRLYQEMQRLVDAGVSLESILYFNFDDERFKPYDASLLNDVVEAYFAMFPQAKTEGAYFFFDEVQEVPEWGAFMRRMVDTQKATIYVTGSSSKMLSLDLATEFRGRSLSREMFPMSFAEFVRFHDYSVDVRKARGATALSSSDVAQLRNACSAYLEKGGFIATQNLETSDAIQLLQDYANRTVNYDVIERYSITNPRAASLFLARCIASSGRELSVNKVVNEFKSRGISISRETLSRLLSYYEDAYLLFSVREQSVALAENPRSVSKLYAVDPAMFGAFSPARATDAGQRLETAVFDKLRREAFTGRSNVISRAMVGSNSRRHEIDFVVGDALLGEEPQLIQVSTSIEDEAARKRELSALEAGMRRFETDQAILVTFNDDEEVEISSGTIRIVPAWRWLLG